MSIPLALGFAPGYQGPLDDRDVVADVTARNAIPPIQRYIGMKVHVTAAATNYQLIGGILDANWTDIGAGAGVTLAQVNDTSIVNALIFG